MLASSSATAPEMLVDVSYAVPQAHGIANVFFRYRIYIFPRDEGFLSCLRLTLGVTSASTTRLYRGYVN
jgi:hypothetical protein